MIAPPIVLEPDYAAAASELGRALADWNEQQAGPRHTHLFALTIRAGDGDLLAGLAGEMFWTFLYISLLWVKDGHRRKGYGAALMQRAEALGREHPCSVAFLNTMSFQAPEFYRKCGYEQFATVPYSTGPHTRMFFAKRLSQ